MGVTRVPYQPLLATFGDEAMAAVFSVERTIQSWLDVEVALAQAQGELGVIPASAAAAITEHIRTLVLEPEDLLEGTRLVGYPILPLLRAVGSDASPDVAAYLHWGATTQDVMDTGLVLQLRAALERLEELELRLGDELAVLAQRHRDTLMAARTHGQQAVPTTFGAKVAVWLDEVTRQLARLREARARVLAVQLFGAGGTAAALGTRSREVRHAMAWRLGLVAVDVAWHAARDRLAEACFVAVGISTTCVRIAREVADLARTEIGEVREAMEHGRGASSTMPQKANPILSEAIVGMGMLATNQLAAVLAAQQPRHERATGEWQIEWDALPELFCQAAGAVARTIDVVAGLAINAERMSANQAADGGMIMAEALMMALAPSVGRGPSHDLVYDFCLVAREQRRPLVEVARERIAPEVAQQLPSLDEILDPVRYLGEAPASVDWAVAGWVEGRGPR